MSRRRQGLQNVGQITAKNDELDQNPAYSLAIYTDVMGIAFVTNKAYNCHNVERDKDSCITNDEEHMRSGSDNVYEYPQPIPACPTHDKLTHTIGFNYIPGKPVPQSQFSNQYDICSHVQSSTAASVMASNPASQPIQELKPDTTTHSDGSESPQLNAEYVPNQAISAVIEQHQSSTNEDHDYTHWWGDSALERHQSSTNEDHDYTHWWGTVLLSDIRALPMRTMTIHTGGGQCS